MGTTTNHAWPTPEDTDAVADGAAAIRALADAIDTDVATKSDTGHTHAASGAEMATGTYTGNGSAGRTIAVGFAPDFVVLKMNGAHNHWLVADEVIALKLWQSNTVSGVSSIGLAATGFDVGTDFDGANSSGQSYRWVAWKDA